MSASIAAWSATKNHIPILMWRAQHIGHHVTAWQQRRQDEMPIAVAIGWEPSLGFCAGSPVPKGICEYDVMGCDPRRARRAGQMRDRRSLRAGVGRDRDRGHARLDPESYMMEGPYAEFTGYVAGDRVAEADDPRHLHHPSQRSDPARHHRRLRCPAAFPRTR